MSDHFFAIDRGKDGFKISDFTFGASSTAARDIELRIADVDGQGNVLTRKDVMKALEAFERIFTNGAMFTNFPKL